MRATTKQLDKLQRFSLSFTSWFCVPDQGMKDFEVLCRASAFLLPAGKDVSIPPQLALVMFLTFILVGRKEEVSSYHCKPRCSSLETSKIISARLAEICGQ
jgi:hypothetical protein